MAMTYGFWIVLLGSIGLSLLVILPLALYVRGRAIAELRANLPESPQQILDKRFASGQISAQEYEYERYLLKKDE